MHGSKLLRAEVKGSVVTISLSLSQLFRAQGKAEGINWLFPTGTKV